MRKKGPLAALIMLCRALILFRYGWLIIQIINQMHRDWMKNVYFFYLLFKQAKEQQGWDLTEPAEGSAHCQADKTGDPEDWQIMHAQKIKIVIIWCAGTQGWWSSPCERIL